MSHYKPSIWHVRNCLRLFVCSYSEGWSSLIMMGNDTCRARRTRSTIVPLNSLNPFAIGASSILSGCPSPFGHYIRAFWGGGAPCKLPIANFGASFLQPLRCHTAAIDIQSVCYPGMIPIKCWCPWRSPSPDKLTYKKSHEENNESQSLTSRACRCAQ
jgi:hypothetical protein